MSQNNDGDLPLPEVTDLGNYRIRKDEPSCITMYHEGFELARTTDKAGWEIRVGGRMVDLDEVLTQLTALKAQLDRMRDAFG